MSRFDISHERQNQISITSPSHLLNRSTNDSRTIHSDATHDRTGAKDSIGPYSNTINYEPSSKDTDNGKSFDNEHDTKRPRACDACRTLKVRCDQDINNPGQPCTRCVKANRSCVVTPPSRKRQRRSENKVVELEKKIDALTATLLSKQQPGAGSTCSTSPRSDSPSIASPRERLNDRSEHSDHYARRRTNPSDSARGNGYSQGSEKTIGHKRRKFDGSYSAEQNINPQNLNQKSTLMADKTEAGDADIQGFISSLIDIEVQEKIFNKFINFHMDNLPILAFPPGTKPSYVRESRSLLYLAILVAAGATQISLAIINKLHQKLKRKIAEDILIEGHKSVELIQVLHITCFWYRPSSTFAKHTFYQLINMAASMAIELGLDRPASRYRFSPSSTQDPYLHWVLPNPDSIECRRAWLVCYYCCTWTALNIKRPVLFKWTSYIEACLKVLQSSPEASDQDEILCHYVQLAHIWEDVTTQFAMDDPSAALSISDLGVVHQIKAFENRLEEWRATMPEEADPSLFNIFAHTTLLQIHEIALYVNHNTDDFKMPFHDSSLRFPKPGMRIANADHLASISACVTAAQSTLQSFFELSLEQLLSLPAPLFIRIGYSMVILIKINMAILTPNSTLGKIISRSELKIDDYFDKLTEKFERMTEDDSIGPSQTLLSFKRRMQSWLQSMGGVVNRKDESGKDDLQNRNKTADAGAKSNVNPNLRSGSQSADTTTTRGPPLASTTNTSGTTRSGMPGLQKASEMQTETCNGLGMLGNGHALNANCQALGHGQEPGLDPILNVPLALNGFDHGTAFPMADFLFGGMESFAGGLIFDGNGGAQNNNGFQGENVPFDFSDAQACPSFIPQL